MMTLRRAVEWCGGIDALGDALNTTAESLERWLSGEEEVPTQVFLQAVGLILEASAAQPPEDRRPTPRTADAGKTGIERGAVLHWPGRIFKQRSQLRSLIIVPEAGLGFVS